MALLIDLDDTRNGTLDFDLDLERDTGVGKQDSTVMRLLAGLNIREEDPVFQVSKRPTDFQSQKIQNYQEDGQGKRATR